MQMDIAAVWSTTNALGCGLKEMKKIDANA
jgi:hypothetical protein